MPIFINLIMLYKHFYLIKPNDCLKKFKVIYKSHKKQEEK